MTPTLFWKRLDDHCKENHTNIYSFVRTYQEETKTKPNLLLARRKKQYPCYEFVKRVQNIFTDDELYEITMDKLSEERNMQKWEKLRLELHLSKEYIKQQRLRRQIQRGIK